MWPTPAAVTYPGERRRAGTGRPRRTSGSSGSRAEQLLHLLNAGAAEVAGNGELERARRHGELERSGRRVPAEEPRDQACGEAVAAAHAVHDLHAVPPALRK